MVAFYSHPFLFYSKRLLAQDPSARCLLRSLFYFVFILVNLDEVDEAHENKFKVLFYRKIIVKSHSHGILLNPHTIQRNIDDTFEKTNEV